MGSGCLRVGMERLGIKPWLEVAAVAAAQHGLVTYAQVRSAGLGEEAVRQAVRSGRLFAVHRGVYAVGYVSPARPATWMAAVLRCGARAELADYSAATAWEIRRGEPWRPMVVVPRGVVRRVPGILTRRANLSPDDYDRHLGIPITSPARTLVDLAHLIEEDEMTRALRRAMYLKLFDLDATREALTRRPNAMLRRLLEDIAYADSFAEDDFLRLCDRFRLPRPEPQWPIAGHRVDFCWPQERVVVEIDGWGAHSTRDAFQRDRSQTNRMQLLGYVVLRFTTTDVNRRARATAAQISAARKGGYLSVT